MTEEGTLGIVMLENTYKVRYASNNPHSLDRQHYKCIGEAELGAFLQQLEIDAWYIQQAFAELWKGGFAGLPISLSDEQIQAYFLHMVSAYAYDQQRPYGESRSSYAARPV